MTLTIDSDIIETDKIKAYEDSDGTVVLEDKVNDNQLELNDDVVLADVASHLVAGDNPHTTTLEQARSEDNQLSGAVDAGGNDLTSVGALGAGDAQIGEAASYQYVSNQNEEVAVPSDFETIQAAIDACPKNLRHDYVINIDPANYSAGPEHIRFRGIKGQARTAGNFVDDTEAGEQAVLRVLGDAATPLNVEVASLTAEACKGEETPQVHGVSFTGSENPDVDESACVVSWHNTDGVSLFDCEIQQEAASNPTLAYKSHIEMRRVDIDGSYNRAVYFKRGGSAIVRDCTGDPGATAFNNGGTMGEVHIKDQSVFGGGTAKPPQMDLYRGVFGTHDFLPYAVYDDFRDGGVSERDGGYMGQYADPRRKFMGAIRPTWSIQGSVTATANNGGSVGLESSGSLIEFQTNHRYGSWTWDFSFDTTPSSGRAEFVPFGTGTSDRYRVNVQADGTVELVLDQSSTTQFISGSWTPDTDEHHIGVTRDYVTDEWELFFDGSSLGSAIETTTVGNSGPSTLIFTNTSETLRLQGLRYE